MPTSDRLRRALLAIDAANADDPNTIAVRGETRPKELAHAELATEWIEKLVAEPSDALRLAVRAHHIRRWEIPRSEHPEGRAGYHRWRKTLQAFHAARVGEILAANGYEPDTVARVQALVKKEGLGTDSEVYPEVQALEDALCLVFVETQFRELAMRLDEAKLQDVTRKTLRKMSPAAIAHARELPLGAEDLSLLERAAQD